jgi:hypothetical protein
MGVFIKVGVHGIVVASFKRDGLVQGEELAIKPLFHRFPIIVFGRNVPFAEVICAFGGLYVGDARAVSECGLD